jgi:hypothetical protein
VLEAKENKIYQKKFIFYRAEYCIREVKSAIGGYKYTGLME